MEQKLSIIATEISKIYTSELMRIKKYDSIRCTEIFLTALKYALKEISKHQELCNQLTSIENTTDKNSARHIYEIAIEISKVLTEETIKDKNYNIIRCTEIYINTFVYAITKAKNDKNLISELSQLMIFNNRGNIYEKEYQEDNTRKKQKEKP